MRDVRPPCPLYPRLALATLLAVAGTSAARAAPLDVDLTGLIDSTTTTRLPRNAEFKQLMQEMAVVFTPTSLQPAETTGQSGFDFGVDLGLHDISESERYWKDGLEGRLQNRSVPSMLQTLGVRGRKGFILPVPLTSELEMGANWLVDSSLVNVGANLRVALHEGFVWLPDLAVQVGVHNTLGADEMQLVTAAAGAAISKSFGVGGTFNFCPFLSYQSLFFHASTRVIDPDPTDTSDIGSNVVFQEIPIYQWENRTDRVSFGARMQVAVVQLTVGADLNWIPDGAARRMMTQMGARAALAF